MAVKLIYKRYYSNLKDKMIAEEIQLITVEPAIVTRAENLARRAYKKVNWLKLLSMQRDNQNYVEVDNILCNQIHENFIMEQGFWDDQIKRKLAAETFSYEDANFCLMALDDGPYFIVAGKIANRAAQQYMRDRKKMNFAISTIEKIIAFFNYDKVNGSQFYRHLRSIYEMANNVEKIRQSYKRQIQQSFNDVDMAFDAYKLWETNPSKLAMMEKVYLQARKAWEQETIDFDEKKLSRRNVRRSLFELQYRSVMDAQLCMEWLDYLQNLSEKLWFLRRWVLNYGQMIPQYMTHCELFFASNEETIIKKYKTAIRISQNLSAIEQRYIYFLARRINKHLLNQQLDESYNTEWGNKVSFMRQQITNLIIKERKLITPTQQNKIFYRYYRLWIEIEQNIVKDKAMIGKLYENLIWKDKEKPDVYEMYEYGKSLIALNAFRDAKEVFKKAKIINVQTLKSFRESNEMYKQFIGLYGKIEDQVEATEEEKKKEEKQRQLDMEKLRQIQRQKEEKQKQLAQDLQKKVNDSIQEIENNATIQKQNAIDQITNNHQLGLLNNKPIQQNREDNALKRQRNKDLDEVEQKIETGLRKKVHVDGQNTVFMKGIPTDWSESDVLKVLKLQSKVICVRLVVKNTIQKDYCYIQFDSNESAQEEVRTNQSGYKLFISRPPADYDETKTLFLCALPQTATAEKITLLFGDHSKNIMEVRLKLEKDKNYAYVDFNSKENKQLAFHEVQPSNPLIDGKKIIVQQCDSNRQKNKKFTQVVFLKGIAFRAEASHIEEYFKDKKIVNISIPKNSDGRGKGFAYVEFEKFKDYQQALDTRKGTILGREFQILKSDRQITQSNPNRVEQKQASSEHKPAQRQRKPRPPKKEKQAQGGKTNNYFSSLFK